MRVTGAGIGWLIGLLATVTTPAAGGCSCDGGEARAGAGPVEGPAAGAGSASGPDGAVPEFDSPRAGAAGTRAQVQAGTGNLPPPNCVGETKMAEEAPVDMYIMLDKSGSMLEATGAGPTKWDAIRDALSSFVQDPQSAGLGVGLQYFPLQEMGVPDSCLSDADCGDLGGPCTTKACLPPPPPFVGDFELCLQNSDCPALSPGCADFGTCSADPLLACFGLGPGGCGDMGDCEPYVGECLFYATCDIGRYRSPAVDIGLLPGHAPAVVSSLNAEMPKGLTPTSAALAGAIEQAQSHALANPDHKVIAVLATDGLPTDCLPVAIDEVAAFAAAGLRSTPSVETYVIGVFAPDDPSAMQNLDQLARSGGTGSAFIVDPSQDVGQQFQDALSEIRKGTLACEFQLPPSPVGVDLEYLRVNVELTQGGSTQQLVYVAEQGRCDEAELGWYYDVVPGSDSEPTKILVCEDTCDTLGEATDAQVEIRLGCATRRPD